MFNKFYKIILICTILICCSTAAYAYTIVELGPQYFPRDDIGRPIPYADIYVGQPDLDPKITANQKQLSVRQEDGTVVAVSQPISTGAGGVPLYNDSPVTLLVNGDYSLKVFNSSGSQVYYITSMESQSLDPGAYYYPHYGATDQGVTGNSDTAKSIIDAAGSKNITIVFANDSGGDTTEYVFASGITFGKTISLEFENGAMLTGTAAIVLDGCKIKSEKNHIFSGVILSGQPAISAFPIQWTGAVADDGIDDTVAVQAAIDSEIKPLLRPEGEYTFDAASGLSVTVSMEMIGSGTFVREKNNTTLNADNALFAISPTIDIDTIEVRGGSFKTSSDSGIFYHDNGATNTITNFICVDATFDEWDSAVTESERSIRAYDIVMRGQTPNYKNVTITHNRFIKGGRLNANIRIDSGVSTGSFDVSHNIFEKPRAGAILLGNDGGPVIYNGVVSHNKINGSNIGNDPESVPLVNMYGMLIYGNAVSINNNVISNFNRYDNNDATTGNYVPGSAVSGYCYAIYEKGPVVNITGNEIYNSGSNCVIQIKGDVTDPYDADQSIYNKITDNIVWTNSLLTGAHGQTGSEDPAIIKASSLSGIISDNILSGVSGYEPYRGIFLATQAGNGRYKVFNNIIEECIYAIDGTGKVTDDQFILRNNALRNCDNDYNFGAYGYDSIESDQYIKYSTGISGDDTATELWVSGATSAGDFEPGNPSTRPVLTIAEAFNRIPKTSNATYTIYIYGSGTSTENLTLSGPIAMGGRVHLRGAFSGTTVPIGYLNISNNCIIDMLTTDISFTNNNSGPCVYIRGPYQTLNMTDCEFNDGAATIGIKVDQGQALMDNNVILALASGATAVQARLNGKIYVKNLSGTIAGTSVGYNAQSNGTIGYSGTSPTVNTDIVESDGGEVRN